MKGIICGALMALTITAAIAEEDLFSANYILPACKAFAEDKVSGRIFVQGVCAGRVESLTFALRNLSKGPIACADIPRSATAGQVALVIVRYIEARPQRMHESFHWLAVEAMMDAWPCKP